MISNSADDCVTRGHVVVTGASGFVGRQVVRALLGRGYRVSAVGRRRPQHLPAACDFFAWDFDAATAPSVFAGCDGIIHLAGAPIFRPWTQRYKNEIRRSRVNSALAIFSVIKDCPHKPQVFVSASATGFYGHSDEVLFTESSPQGTDFLAQVCGDWENAARQFSGVGVRSVQVRTGIVFGKGGGMLAQLLPSFRLGFATQFGDGKQQFSWIHIDDLVAIYLAALTDPQLQGPINAVTPELVRHSDFVKMLAGGLKARFFLKIPAWIIRLGLGGLAALLLSSQRVFPQKMLGYHFPFQFPDLEQALSHSISGWRMSVVNRSETV